jgi:hypothetical protein
MVRPRHRRDCEWRWSQRSSGRRGVRMEWGGPHHLGPFLSSYIVIPSQTQTACEKTPNDLDRAAAAVRTPCRCSHIRAAGLTPRLLLRIRLDACTKEPCHPTGRKISAAKFIAQARLGPVRSRHCPWTDTQAQQLDAGNVQQFEQCEEGTSGKSALPVITPSFPSRDR